MDEQQNKIRKAWRLCQEQYGKAKESVTTLTDIQQLEDNLATGLQVFNAADLEILQRKLPLYREETRQEGGAPPLPGNSAAAPEPTPATQTNDDQSLTTSLQTSISILESQAESNPDAKLKYDRGSLSDTELEHARITIVQNHQRKHLSSEINCLTEPGGTNPPNRENTQWFDRTTGVLRLLGRVTTENMPFEQRAPVIISTGGKLAQLLMRYAHEQTGHGGAQQMLQYIRQLYWILKARQLAKAVIHRCNQCRRHHLTTANTLMASLPAERTTPERAFKQSGVDYMGPINIASRHGRAPQITRGYVSVFVCLVTRAIHLEVVSDGTKEKFIQALRRFFGRRGLAKQMWSDNGTTFVGANNYLQTIGTNHKQWAPDIEHEFHLKWTFIVPRAPSWGGGHLGSGRIKCKETYYSGGRQYKFNLRGMGNSVSTGGIMGKLSTTGPTNGRSHRHGGTYSRSLPDWGEFGGYSRTRAFNSPSRKPTKAMGIGSKI